MPIIKRLLFLSLLIILTTYSTFAAEFYWVGGSGKWNEQNHWSYTSGGRPAKALPGGEDNVYFDNNSFPAGGSLTIEGKAICRNMKWSGLLQNVSISGSGSLSITGSLKFHSRLKNDFQGSIYFISADKATITTAGVKFQGNVYFNGDGSWTLSDDLSASAAKIHLEKGTLVTGDKNIVCGSFIGSGEMPRSLLLGNSKLRIKEEWNFSETKNLTLDAASSQIAFEKNKASYVKLGDGIAYGKIKIDPLPSLLSHVATVTVTPVSCNGRCDGTATVSVTGAVGPLSYQWVTSSQTTATVTGLCPQNIYCLVTDHGNGDEISVSNSENITEPSALQIISFNNTRPSCFGACDGRSVPVVAPGTPPYTYSWSAGGQTSAIATGLCAGTYTLTVTDANLCTTSRTTTITQPNPLVTNGSTTSISCNGLCNGQAGVAPTGGTSPYTYAWAAGGQTTTGISNLCVGSYTATVTDSKGCSATYVADVTQPAILTVTTSSVNVTCGGLCNATAGATPAGGTAPYTYAWSPGGEVTASVTGLCPATYTIQVRDSRGCSNTQTVLITEPPPLTSVPTATNVSCFGLCDGRAGANAAGGSAPYSYSWSNGSTNAVATGLCSGSYTVTITDFRLCVTTATVTITQPLVLAANLTRTNVSCSGICDGTASSAPTGGTAPYTYLWNPGAFTTSSISMLCAGAYTATVTDANSCIATGTVSVTQPAALSAGITNTNILCNGSCIGTASITPGGGTVPYTYAWSPGGQTTQAVTGLCAGTYTATIRDANNCILTRTVTITQPNALTVSITSNSVTCNNTCDGAAAASPAGGTAPYTYLWSNSATTATITGLCSGTYTVTIRDANTCVGTQTVNISEPAVLTGVPSNTDITCNGECDGTASVLAGGGTSPYIYSWNPGGETTSAITGLCAGSYTVTLTDGNSCLLTNIITITEPVVLSANPSATNVSCAGDCDGALTANPAGGTAPYTYLWSAGGETTQSVTGLCAGGYDVLVTDNSGCQSNQPVTITQPAVLNAALGTVVNTCSSCTGSAEVSPTGGTAPYTYLWSDGQTTSTASNLCLGTYTITVTDAESCTATNVVTINQTVNIAITFSSPNVSCFGACDGIAVANPSGGFNPYTYNWSPGSETTQTLTGLCAGTYSVTVQDSLGCFNTGVVVLTEPALLTLTTTATDASCNGACDGSIGTTVAGGTMPYTYAWLPGNQTSTSITGLCAGTYTINVRDANNCIATETVTITQASAIAANPSVTNATCLLNDGGINLAPSGGAGGYSFLWAPGGETTQSITNLFAGTYSVTITDAASCTGITTINVNNPTGPTVSSSQVNVTCFGGCNGVGSVTVTAGNGPYDYLWNPGGQISTSVSNLCEGVYNVRVTDALGCITLVGITITEPALISPVVSISNVSCGGSCDGDISLSVAGGISPYTYAWSAGAQTTSSISGLCAATYTVDITDANMCVSTETIVVAEPAVLTVTITGNDASCNGYNNGGAVASVSGGATPYTYLWSPGGQIISTITNLSPGTYTLNVTDANSCVITGTVSISQPTVLTSTVTGTNISCNSLCDGTAAVSASGGTSPYTYSWNPGSETTSSISALCAATYSAVVTDINGCIAVNTIGITEPTAFDFGFAATNVSCNSACDGAITTNVTGGASPYTYQWSPGGETASGISSLCAGTYTLLITDASLCTASQPVTITEPPILQANVSSSPASCATTCDGAAFSSPVGGSGPYTYQWSPGGATTSSISGICAGTYTVLVIDANSCTDEQTIIVSDPVPITILSAVAGANCGMCNGSITITPSGGTGLNYTYLWNPAGSTEATVTGLCAGLYTVTVQDSLACSTQFIIPLNNTGGPTGETITNTDASCNGACDGTSTIVPIGGTSPYTYSWSPGSQTTNSLTGMCAGVYILQVTDANSCIRFVQDTIFEPTPIVPNAAITNATCNGICDGAIALAPTGGAGSYTYVWMPGGETTAGINPACAGTYTVTITDLTGCSLVYNPVVGQNAVVSITLTASTNTSCNGSCDGSASTSVSGGTAPYTFLWSDPMLQSDSIATGLCAGTYTLTVTDFNGCQGTQIVTITEPAVIALNPAVVDATCGLCDGQVTLSPTGGVSPFTYAWSDGQTGAIATGLCAAAYNILVTDSNGCANSLVQLISNIGGPTGENVVTTNVNCFGNCNGTASITPVGGTAPYSYLWIAGGQTTNVVTGLCGGTYFIQIQDSNNCVRTTSLSIAEPPQFIINQSVVSANCGVCDGVITLNPTGGTAPYTYAWSPGGETTSTVTGLCVGMYTVNVSDAGGCGQQFAIPVSNPTGPAVTFTVTDANCNGLCDGSIITSVSGNSPYTYLWNLGQTDDSVTGLCEGNYYVQVTDNNLCVTIATATVSEPSLLAYNIPVAIDPLCNGDCNGAIIAIPFGGTIPYTYAWSSASGTAVSGTALCAGSYTVTVTDNNGCTVEQTAVLDEPFLITISNAVIDASCSNSSDGSINITVAGGTQPYTFQWVAGSTSTSEDLINIGPGTYSVIVTDVNGCTGTDSIVVNSTIVVDAIAGTDTTFCEGDSVLINGTGSVGTSFNWYRLPSPTVISTNLIVTVKPFTGSNTYMLVSYNGSCTDTDYVVVTSLSLPLADAGNDATIFSNTSAVIGGLPTGPSGSVIHWAPPAGLSDTATANPVATPSVTTTYTVTVTNANGCSSTDTVRVTVLPKIVFPNGISPNGDGKNDVWIIDNIHKFPEALVEVYNRWGELLFRSVGYTTKFDGTYNGKPLPVGTYYYIINLNSPEFPEAYTGPITIMR